MPTWPNSKQDICFLRLKVTLICLLFLLILFCDLVSDSIDLLTIIQIARRRAAHLLKYPDAEIISLGIGDTTEPIPDVITNAMAEVPSRCEK